MKFGLLIIGDEILNGRTLDTNSHFVANLLRDNNFELAAKLTVSDTYNAIKNGLDVLFKDADIIISTGGLGPTKDDITKQTVTDYFSTKLVENEEVLNYLTERYAKRGKPLNNLNKTQALVPEGAEIIISKVGTAPVMWLKKNGKQLITLPGVPGEMRYLLNDEILPKLKERFQTGKIIQRSILTIGIAESALAMKLTEAEAKIEAANSENEYYKLAYLPKLLEVKLQLTARGEDEDLLNKNINSFQTEIEAFLGEYIYGYDDTTLSGNVGKLLKDKKATVSTAESCTGGYLAHLFTANSGSSEYYWGSIISYDNSVKMKQLNVSEQTLKNHGAVSEECCVEMVKGALQNLGTTYAIATTGIAGPGGGSDEKPSGTVWIGVGNKENIIAKKYHFGRNREENIHLFAITALDMMRKFLKGYKI